MSQSRLTTITINGTPTIIDLLSNYTQPTRTMLFGWSGSDIPNVTQDIIGTWMGRANWGDLSAAHWIGPGLGNNGYLNYIAAHPDRAVDLGVPLIPTGSGTAYNTLLDNAINNDTVTVGSGTATTDAVYYSMGANIAAYGPQTVYARVWWEMNQSPDPQATTDRSKFIAAWNRAIPQIRAGFAAQAPSKVLKIVFCPLSDGADYTAYYPGDSTVDVIAMDIYGCKYGSSIPSSSTLLSWTGAFLKSIGDFAKSHNKPVAMGEWANWQLGTNGNVGSHGLGDFPDYINQVFDWAAEYNAEYMVYFNLSDGGVGITLADTPNSLLTLQGRLGDQTT